MLDSLKHTPTKELAVELRRRGWAVIKIHKDYVLSPSFIVYGDRNEIFWRGQVFELSQRTMDVVRFLAAIHPRRVTYREIAHNVWGEGFADGDPSPRAYIRHLRRVAPELIVSNSPQASQTLHIGLNVDEGEAPNASEEPPTRATITHFPRYTRKKKEGNYVDDVNNLTDMD